MLHIHILATYNKLLPQIQMILRICIKIAIDIINFINCMGLSEYFTSKSCLSFTRWNSRRHFFYNNKSWNRKKISICKCEKFLTFDVKNVLLFWWANSIKTNLQTCNLHTCHKLISFDWIYPQKLEKRFFTSNDKKFSHLQMNIFCCFNFYYCRRIALWQFITLLWVALTN